LKFLPSSHGATTGVGSKEEVTRKKAGIIIFMIHYTHAKLVPKRVKFNIYKILEAFGVQNR